MSDTRDIEERWKRIQSYVRERLKRQIADGPRGTQAQLAKDLGVEGPHLSNIVADPPSRMPGEILVRSAAARWGLSMDELEALALGEAPPVSRKPQTGRERGVEMARLDHIREDAIEAVIVAWHDAPGLAPGAWYDEIRRKRAELDAADLKAQQAQLREMSREHQSRNVHGANRRKWRQQLRRQSPKLPSRSEKSAANRCKCALPVPEPPNR